MKIQFEHSECSRCAGRGRLEAFSGVYGGVCFGCNGKGQKMTAAGRRAYKKVQEVQSRLCVKAASQVQVGERVALNGGTKFSRVTNVKVSLGKGNGSSRSGVVGSESYSESWVFGNTTLWTSGGSQQGPAHRAVTVAWNSETLAVAAEAVKNMKGAVVIP